MDRPMRALFFLILVISATGVQAHRFHSRMYTQKEGLPASAIQSMAQDSRGYLWISTYGGLSRFDGRTFKNYDINDGLPNYFATYSFAEDSAGTLWFSSKFNATSFDGVYFRQYPIVDAPNDVWINQLLETRNNRVRFVTWRGVFELQDSIWHRVRYDTEVDAGIGNLLETGRDTFLASCYKNVLLLLPDGRTMKIFNNPDRYPLRGFVVAGHRRYLMSSNFIYEVKDSGMQNITPPAFWNKYMTSLLVDRFGRRWIGTEEQGLYVFDSTNRLLDTLFTHTKCYFLLEDREGTIWAGTGIGLAKITPTVVAFMQDHIPKNTKCVRSCYKDRDGNLYFGHNLNGFTMLSRGRMVPSEQLIDNEAARHMGSWTFTIARDKEQRLWLLCNDLNLYRVTGKKVESISKKVGEQVFSDCICYSDTENCIYYGGKFGLVQIKNESARTWTLSKNTGAYIRSFAKSPDRQIWFGNQLGRLYKISPFTNDTTSFDPGIGTVTITGILFESNTVFWLLTEGKGIYQFEKQGNSIRQIRHFSREDGLPDNMVFKGVADKQNRLWLITNKGICYLQKDRFTQNFQITNFGNEYGLNNENLKNGDFVVDDNGYLWIGNDDYLAKVDANHIVEDTTSTVVHLENVQLFYKTTDWQKFTNHFSQFFHLPEDPVLPSYENTLTFNFSAISFNENNNTAYAYFLEGADTGWVNCGSNTQISFGNLRPGKYIFRVKAKKPNSAWSTNNPALKFEILQPWWNTIPMRITFFLAIIGTVYVLFKARLKYLIRLQNLRNKIASDLHDEIGSTLNSISIYSEVAKQNSEQKDEALTRIGDSSRQIIDSMSDIVWTINPENDDFEHIIDRMRSYCHSVFSMSGIEYTFIADEHLSIQATNMEFRKNFYLIFKEALNNILKYSGTKQVKVLLAKQNGKVVLTIEDFGRGFDHKAQQAGNGLKNMRKRAVAIHATIHIESVINSGTKIELKLEL